MPNFNDSTRGQVVAEKGPTGYQYFYISPNGIRELIRRQDKKLHENAFMYNSFNVVSWSFGMKARHHNGPVYRKFKIEDPEDKKNLCRGCGVEVAKDPNWKEESGLTFCSYDCELEYAGLDRSDLG